MLHMHANNIPLQEATSLLKTNSLACSFVQTFKQRMQLEGELNDSESRHTGQREALALRLSKQGAWWAEEVALAARVRRTERKQIEGYQKHVAAAEATQASALEPGLQVGTTVYAAAPPSAADLDGAILEVLRQALREG